MAEPVSVFRAAQMFCSVVFWEQMHGFFDQLNEAFLPLACKHSWSGLTGLLYALPPLVSSFNDCYDCDGGGDTRRMTPLGKLSWYLQALLSVLADYVYIGYSTPIHGIDRYLATLNFVRVIFVFFAVANADKKDDDDKKKKKRRGLLLTVVYCALGTIPVCAHLLARIAKVDMNAALVAVEGGGEGFVGSSTLVEDFERHKNEWIKMHGWWHVTSALLVAFIYESSYIVLRRGHERRKGGKKRGAAAAAVAAVVSEKDDKSVSPPVAPRVRRRPKADEGHEHDERKKGAEKRGGAAAAAAAAAGQSSRGRSESKDKSKGTAAGGNPRKSSRRPAGRTTSRERENTQTR